MRLLDSPGSAAESKHIVASVVTGNGTTEMRVLRGLASSFNGKKRSILFAKTPMRWLGPKKKGSGKKATGLRVLDALSNLEVTRFGHVLVVLDREHVSHLDTSKKIQKELDKKASRLFNNYEIIPDSASGLYTISGGIGSRKVRCSVVVSGEVKCIEENLARLISLRYATSLPAQKTEIKKFLRSKGNISIEKLVGNAPMAQLQEAFPGLCQVFEMLETKE